MHSIPCIRAGQGGSMVITMADRPQFNPDSVVPLYEQAADWIAARITAGDLAHGSKLPSERDLAEQWGIAYQTVRRAMQELRERGLVVSRVGKGTFIV